MAKTKKTTAKAAKKPAKKASAKPAAKAKKTVAKVKKAAAPKKKVAKKAAKPAKAVKAAAPAKKTAAPKKQADKKPVVAKKTVATKPVKTTAAPKTAAPKKAKETQKVQPTQATNKPTAPSPSQLTMFQMPNQRPIAHKQAVTSTPDDKTRYSEEELKEFESLILKKLEKAREEYKILKDTLNRNNDEGTDATSGGNTKVLEDGAETAEKENLSQLAARQQKYITNLENALVRIKNGTYGICSVTGKLIPKERLIAVPHTTQSIEAKMMQQD